MQNTFSALNRPQYLNQLKSELFDLVIIGGGATGCGIALDAASRGIKTALLEKVDFAAGTSSKSTKLIHGGLRYLKQLEIGLVRETGTERAIVHQLAPHLVIPEKMLLPIIENGNYGKMAASFGVMVYDLLAGVEKDDRRIMLSREDSLKQEPLLDERSLEGGCFYAEYRTDDARLSIELVKRAASHGALPLNYCKVVNFIYENDIIDLISGVEVQDELTGESFQVKAKQVVVAGGPWVDELRKIDGSKSGKQLHLTKGVHIVFPHDKLPVKQSVYFDNADGRMIFAIPRGRITYVGTTDTNYKGSLDRVVATKADADYLLKAIGHAFPSKQLSESDIISNWAGLRPLIHEEGKSPSELSRKDEIFESNTGLISIAGGKLTGYRKMAQRIVDKVEERLGKEHVKCKTDQIALVEPSFLNSAAVERFMENQLESLDAYQRWYLTTTYGQQATRIVEKAKEYDDPFDVALIRAELWFGVHHEMVNGMVDFFLRRTGRLYFDIESISQMRDVVCADLIKYLNWDECRRIAELQKLDELVYDATHYPEGEYD